MLPSCKTSRCGLDLINVIMCSELIILLCNSSSFKFDSEDMHVSVVPVNSLASIKDSFLSRGHALMIGTTVASFSNNLALISVSL